MQPSLWFLPARPPGRERQEWLPVDSLTFLSFVDAHASLMPTRRSLGLPALLPGAEKRGYGRTFAVWLRVHDYGFLEPREWFLTLSVLSAGARCVCVITIQEDWALLTQDEEALVY